MKRTNDTYKPEVKVYEYPGWKITVHFPDITPEERERRMKKIHDAAAELLMCEERIMKEHERTNSRLQ